MAIPKIFISSTCYDLKYIRENLKLFIKNIGYDSVLSEEGDVYYNTNIHTHDACLSEVSSCQIFVLIIGGRYGGKYKSEDTSITNMEYRQAVELKIPIFTIVEQSVYSEHYVYTKNKGESCIDETKICYPSVDNVKIFDFIDEVRERSINNAIFPFKNYSDIEQYLRKQWAGMMYLFLTSQSESKRVSQLFEQIQTATDKIEFYTRLMANTVAEETTKAIIQMYDIIVQSNATSDLRSWKFAVTPSLIFNNPTLEDLCKDTLVISNEEANSITYGGPPYRLSRRRYEILSREYSELHINLKKLIDEKKMSIDDIDKLSNEF